MKKMYVSWITPPEDGEKFSIYTKNNRMIICESREYLEQNKEELLGDDEILGWLPILTGNQVPAFMPNIPSPQIESK